MMWKPNSGIARGELRSTLSRAGSCRSSANNINEESRIRTRGLRRSGNNNGGPNGEAGAEMNETAPKGTASSMFRQPGDCHVM